MIFYFFLQSRFRGWHSMKLWLKLRNKWLLLVVVQVLQWIIDFCPWPHDYLELYPIKGAAAAACYCLWSTLEKYSSALLECRHSMKITSFRDLNLFSLVVFYELSGQLSECYWCFLLATLFSYISFRNGTQWILDISTLFLYQKYFKKGSWRVF